MNWIPIAAALGVALIVVLLQRGIVRELRLASLPDHIRNVLKHVPDLKIDRLLAKGNRYQFSGRSRGRPIEVKVRTVGVERSSSIEKIQIQWETRNVYRSLKNKRLVETSQVPEVVIEAAREAVEFCVGPLDVITRVHEAETQGCRAYDIRGRTEEYRVEIEALDNGDLLELELRPK